MNNQQGKRAEDIFSVRITQDYIFRARDLGAKWPVSDYYVEIDNEEEPLSFIVQVKSSSRGYNAKGNFRISVSRESANQLASYRAPTFIAGVDIEKEMVYLSPLYRKRATGISTLSTIFALSERDQETSRINLQNLRSEIKKFWNDTNAKIIKENFKSTLPCHQSKKSKPGARN